jgi:hypothetical protein
MSKRNRHWKHLPAMVALFALTACSGDNTPVRGFVMPEGDVAQGEQVFVDFNCHACHTIPGKEFPEVENEPPFVLALGGEVYRVKNHGELLTAVVNPDQSICMAYRVAMRRAGREVEMTPMPYRGEDMTVAELVDLVTFLNAQYTKLQPKHYTGYYNSG